ncbi:acetyltransferase [Nostoc minutum NIES-26]|uniref:Acetyltransferase n=1 Tax=Nostoc minutum NIES-26 TaxID=1844469 RepID=A0A367Q1U1_9NOSO|nr:acetyltransferase [Nostoc minutum NIES-26]
MPAIELSTPRLIGDRLRTEHLDWLCIMHQDPKVMATLAGVRSNEQTKLFLQENLTHWERYRFGLWMFRDKIDNRFVGRGGLRNIHIAGNDEVELAYSLMAEFWGKGLATEMGKAILKVGFQQIGLPEIVCFTMTTNFASQRVMQKLGFQYERDIVHADLPHVFYRLKAPAK